MISIVSVYNNREKLNNFLLKGLKNQTGKYELILMDNTYGQFKSAAEALNIGGKKAKGDYIMFVHQDVFFGSNSTLEESEKILNNLKNLGIAGVAGKVERNNYMRNYIISNITHGNPPRRVENGTLTKVVKVHTLDECLIIIPKEIFNKYQFDEKTCDDWHIYGVDYCLTIQRYGYNVYVLPLLSIHHGSEGFLSKEFFFTLEKILNKHKAHYKRIFGTIGNYHTIYSSKMLKWWRFLKTSNKRKIKKVLGQLLFYYYTAWRNSRIIKVILNQFFLFNGFFLLTNFEVKKLKRFNR